MKKNNASIIIDASNRFFSEYKDSFGFLLLMHLAKNGSISLVENYSGCDEAILCTLDVDFLETISSTNAKDWRLKGISAQSYIVESVKESNKEAVEILFQDFKETIINSGKEPSLLWDVISMLCSVDYFSLGDEYSKLFQKAASRIYIGSKPNKIWRPAELDKFLAEVAGYDGGILLNLRAGFGTLCKECNVDGNLYYGMVNNKKEWAAGYLYLSDNGINPAHYTYCERFNHFSRLNVIPKVVISSGGVNIAVIDDNGADMTMNESTESFYLKKWFKELSPSGKFVGLFDSNVLEAFCEVSPQGGKIEGYYPYMTNPNRNGLSSHKEFLKYLETVVLLPKAISRRSKGSLAVLVFNRAKAEDAMINMIDCSNFYLHGVNENIFDCDKAIAAIREDSPAYVLSVSLDEIKKNGYNLNPMYFLNNPIGKMYVPKDCAVRRLSDVVEYYEGETPNGKIARIIKVEPKTFDGKNYKYSFQNGSAKTMLNGECLILCKSGSIRPVFIKIAEGESIGCGSDYFAFRVKPEVYVDYLLVELSKDYVKQQIAIAQQKQDLPIISLADLMKVEVVFPKTIEAQKSKYRDEMEGRFEDNTQEYVRALETNAKILHKEYIKDMHLRKHALSQVLKEFSSGFYRLNEVRQEHLGELNDSMIVASRTGETVSERFEKLASSMEKMQMMVSLLVEDRSIVEDEPEVLFVDSFLAEYVSNIVADNYEPILAIERDELDSEKKHTVDNKYAVFFPKKALTQIFDNIIANARKYGFIEQNSYKYKIRFSSEIVLNNDEPFVAIKIANNGEPLPAGMTAEKVFTWGECSTGGTGLGGWQIRNTARNFGGDAKLNTFDDDPNGYTIEYEIDIPMSKLSK